jgi:hypothetical protein
VEPQKAGGCQQKSSFILFGNWKWTALPTASEANRPDALSVYSISSTQGRVHSVERRERSNRKNINASKLCLWMEFASARNRFGYIACGMMQLHVAGRAKSLQIRQTVIGPVAVLVVDFQIDGRATLLTSRAFELPSKELPLAATLCGLDHSYCHAHLVAVFSTQEGSHVLHPSVESLSAHQFATSPAMVLRVWRNWSWHIYLT